MRLDHIYLEKEEGYIKNIIFDIIINKLGLGRLINTLVH